MRDPAQLISAWGSITIANILAMSPSSATAFTKIIVAVLIFIAVFNFVLYYKNKP